MQGQTKAFTKLAAKELRKTMTDAERRLWHRLRGEQLEVKFRRQHPFENVVLDFVCLERRLVIEVDGSQHVENQHDEKRTERLNLAGFTVLRFWNNEVLNETDAVVQAIWNALNPSPPQPSP
ncbi:MULTISPECIES: endonuclease domain-containing protein [unclassified Herbaspirillum]|jgi:very-short-patch-repair endonuclease|uniref:endonuclease domain-containing protein n=1 Tax=unclassified Herbaspirillum TaxID=2624150 RepID=UPI000E2F312B|nr:MULTISPECIES: endonuclease domain-containing protein [unclassified Herbaspirillum]RFB65553.1 endonuclease domain-containing protein [Herbaspirillum sp. 3R-3a1]TFI08188.1 endonuclease domain-containing protein [Herbaspirillum sp. 3R11]TFI14603.1 endonuclease domain-containing protein [Herbaspirillum sp. 3R-11]TFI24668.1 endonuclease domain-containing protein [Herbaspirillum sp. 3C11]